MDISPKQLEGEYRTVGLFVENAKTYIQLATGALLLSVTFSQGLTGQTGLPIQELYLWVPWLCWLISIITGVTYQCQRSLETAEIWTVVDTALRLSIPFSGRRRAMQALGGGRDHTDARE